jgi:hypothetical protein
VLLLAFGAGLTAIVGSTSLASNTVAPSHAGRITVVVTCHPNPPDPPNGVDPPDPPVCNA